MNHDDTDRDIDHPAHELNNGLRAAVERLRDLPYPERSLQRALDRGARVERFAKRQRRRRQVLSVLAAVVLIAALGFWSLSPSASWAQVADALHSQPWIHATIQGRSGGEPAEVWFSAERGVSAQRQGKWVMYDDHRLRIRYTYEPKEQTLYRVPQEGLFSQREFAAFGEVFDKLLNGGANLKSPLYGAEIVQQERRRVVIDNQTWTEFDLTLHNNVGDQLLRLLFRVPPGSRLPRTMTLTPLGQKAGASQEWVFDYPENGPVDAYAAGVPRTAKLVDRVPTDDLAAVLKGVKVSRERFGSYHAIVATGSGDMPWWRCAQVYLVWRKGNRWRVEMGTVSALDAANPKPPPPDADVLAWWRERVQKSDFVPVSVGNGKAVYQVNFGQRDRDGKQQRTWKELWKTSPDQDAAGSVAQAGMVMLDLYAYPGLPVPSQLFEARLQNAPKEGPAGSVLLDARATSKLPANAYTRSRYWIDPQHSYVTLQYQYSDPQVPSRDDAGKKNEDTYVMERLEESPRGVWYPTLVRRKNAMGLPKPDGDRGDSLTWFFVDFKTDIPDSLFEPQDRKP